MSETQELLQGLAQQPAAVEWFRGLFERAHLQIEDTGETFTAVQHGDHVDIMPGLEGDDPNLIIPLQSENIRNLAGFFRDGGVSADAKYRIVKFMLRPCLEASLKMPVLQNGAVRAILQIDDVWHQSLQAPDGSDDEPLTVQRAGSAWTFTPGHHGTPQRRLRFTPDQAIEYQRHVFAANSKNSLPAWLDMARWYVGFREEITVAA